MLIKLDVSHNEISEVGEHPVMLVRLDIYIPNEHLQFIEAKQGYVLCIYPNSKVMFSNLLEFPLDLRLTYIWLILITATRALTAIQLIDFASGAYHQVLQEANGS